MYEYDKNYSSELQNRRERSVSDIETMVRVNVKNRIKCTLWTIVLQGMATPTDLLRLKHSLQILNYALLALVTNSNKYLIRGLCGDRKLLKERPERNSYWKLRLYGTVKIPNHLSRDVIELVHYSCVRFALFWHKYYVVFCHRPLVWNWVRRVGKMAHTRCIVKVNLPAIIFPLWTQ